MVLVCIRAVKVCFHLQFHHQRIVLSPYSVQRQILHRIYFPILVTEHIRMESSSHCIIFQFFSLWLWHNVFYHYQRGIENCFTFRLYIHGNFEFNVSKWNHQYLLEGGMKCDKMVEGVSISYSFDLIYLLIKMKNVLLNFFFFKFNMYLLSPSIKHNNIYIHICLYICIHPYYSIVYSYLL